MKRVTRYTSAGHTPVTHFFFNRSAGQGSVPALSPPGGLTLCLGFNFFPGFCFVLRAQAPPAKLPAGSAPSARSGN